MIAIGGPLHDRPKRNPGSFRGSKTAAMSARVAMLLAAPFAVLAFGLRLGETLWLQPPPGTSTPSCLVVCSPISILS
jgi:hypothetical protein